MKSYDVSPDVKRMSVKMLSVANRINGKLINMTREDSLNVE